MTGLAAKLGRTLIIAPHPDDEILGCGGMLAMLADGGAETHVGVVTEGRPPLYTVESVAALRAEARAAHRLLGTTAVHWLGQPAAALDQVPHAELNLALATLIVTLAPDTVFLPFSGDVHLDHQRVFTSTMVAVRPAQMVFPIRVLAYETVSETNWNAPGLTPPFVPNLFVDISATLDRKLAAFAAYASQVRSFPSERSVEALTALARLRGATVHRAAAEAFMLIREVA